MIKSTSLLILALVSFISGSCKRQPDPSPRHGLLWKITGNNLTEPSYLFGTYHGPGALAILDSIQGFDSVFTSSKIFVCEFLWSYDQFVTTNKKDSPEDKLLKPWPVQDSTYENLLTEKQKNLLDSVILSDKLLQYAKQANFRPSLLMNAIQFSYIKASQRNQEKHTSIKDSGRNTILDVYLQNRAKDCQMDITALESKDQVQKIADSVYSHLPQVSYRLEAGLLMWYIENLAILDSLKNDLSEKKLSAYLRQNLDLILKTSYGVFKKEVYTGSDISFFQELERYLAARDRLIYDARNNFWMKLIPDLIRENSCFIAVGAGHLPGETGLINQLQQLGYTVVPN